MRLRAGRRLRLMKRPRVRRYDSSINKGLFEVYKITY